MYCMWRGLREQRYISDCAWNKKLGKKEFAWCKTLQLEWLISLICEKSKQTLFFSDKRTHFLSRFLNINFLGLRSFWIRVRRICIRPNPSYPGADKNWWIWRSWRPFWFFLSPSWFFFRSSQLFKINPWINKL